jgi:hypothetical protein
MSPAAALTSGQSCGTLSPMGPCGQTLFSFGRAGLEQQQVVRSLDLVDWGHTVRQTGAVAQLAWAPDNRALAVGFEKQGLVVWTPSGCRLLCTLRQPLPDTPASGRGSVSPFSPNSSSAAVLRPLISGSCEAAANGASSSTPPLQHPGVVSVDGSVLCLAWGVDGYQLVLAGQGPSSSSNDSHSGSSSSGIMYELSLAKSLRHHHRVTHTSAADGGTSTVSAVAQLGDELHVLQVSLVFAGGVGRESAEWFFKSTRGTQGFMACAYFFQHSNWECNHLGKKSCSQRLAHLLAWTASGFLTVRAVVLLIDSLSAMLYFAMLCCAVLPCVPCRQQTGCCSSQRPSPAQAPPRSWQQAWVAAMPRKQQAAPLVTCMCTTCCCLRLT